MKKKEHYINTINKVIQKNKYRKVLRKVLVEKCYSHINQAFLQSEEGRDEIEQHLTYRIIDVEKKMIPWIEEVYDLTYKKILEIGCGTGSMTIPFAMRADEVFSFDIWDTIQVAKKRADLFDLKNITFKQISSDWISDREQNTRFFNRLSNFDVITFDAFLEHLTIPERLAILKSTWDNLPNGGVIIIYETPNRLYYYDWHSFLLPFFDCLPDELAAIYAKRSKRALFKDLLENENWQEKLYNIGRGVSYHEFELSINFSEMRVLNDGYSHILGNRSANDQYTYSLQTIFRKELPNIPIGFTAKSLDLILQKFITMRLQIYFCAENKYSEENSICIDYLQSKWVHLTIDLTGKSNHGRLRLDPANIPGKITIKEIVLIDQLDKKEIWRIDIKSNFSDCDILGKDSWKIKEDCLVVHALTNNPQILLPDFSFSNKELIISIKICFDP